MPIYRLNDSGVWKKLKAYRLNDSGVWKKITGYRLNDAGVWKKIFGAAEPTIESTVTLSKSSNGPSSDYHNSTHPVTLTGTKYHFSGANSYSYRFYSSTTGTGNWVPITSEISTTNPASGSSSTVTYTLQNSDFTATTMYFQFRYTGTNTSVSPSISTTSSSNIESVTFLDIPAPPSGFPNINQSTITVASTASSGTWVGSPNRYDWIWQYGASNNTLTYQASKSISTAFLSGTTVTISSSNHGFKLNDSVSFSGISDLFNQSFTSIYSVFPNSFSYTLSKPTWAFSSQYSANSFVTYNSNIYKALLATPTRTTWSFTTNYSTNQYVNYGSPTSSVYKAIANTPSPRSSWSSTTTYTAGQYVNYNSNVWQATGTSINQTPVSGSDFWNLIDIYPGGSGGYWTLENIDPNNTSYWELQSGALASGGTATGPNYYEGTSSSPISYTINSFPATDYKTGTSLLGLTIRLNVKAFNILYDATYNSVSRQIYQYPLILLGATTLTSTTASIVYAEAYMDVYDIDVERRVLVVSATVSGSNIVYTTDINHGLSSGTFITVSGLSPTSFNRSNVQIISVTSNTITVSNSTATGSSSGVGAISVSGQPYAVSISTYPKTNEVNSSPISITGLVGGKTYDVYITPKNADSPRVSGVQRVTTFTTPSPPSNISAPTIGPVNGRTAPSGYTAYLPVSTTLTATPGTWNNVDANTTYTYTWYIEDSVTNVVTLVGTGSQQTFSVNDVSDFIFVVVKATNSDGSFTNSSSGTYILNQEVAVGTISPTTATINTSTSFSFNISHYPTSYSISWGDGTSNDVFSVTSNTSTVNASVSHTYTATGSYTMTVTAQPGNKTSTATIAVSEATPDAFIYTISNDSSVTAPSTPSQQRVSSTSNTVLVEIASTKPTDTLEYDLNVYGTGSLAGGTLANPAVSTISTLNTYNSSGSTSSGPPYTWDAITLISSSANNSPINMFIRARGTTRTIKANVSTTTGASSWRVNYTLSGVLGAGTYNINTNSMPVTIASVTGATNPTVTINSVTAYSQANQLGATRSGTAGTTTSLSSVPRPTADSGLSSANYTYAAPVAPTTFTASTNDSTKIALSWSGGTADTYHIFETTSSTTAPTSSSTPTYTTTNTSSYDVTGKTRGSIFYYFIRSSLDSVTSAWFPATAPGRQGKQKLYPPPTPTSLSGTVISSSRIDISWSAGTAGANQDAASGYDIYYSTSSTDPTSTTTATTTSTTTSASITGLSASTTYYFWVRATNADNTGSSASAWTTSINRTTTENLSAPSGGVAGTPSLTSGTAGRVGATYSATVTTEATGNPSPTKTYQWQYLELGQSVDTWININGATSSSYTIPWTVNTAVNVPSRKIRCKITWSNSQGSQSSPADTNTTTSLVTIDPPTITNVVSYYYSTASRYGTKANGYPQRPPGTTGSGTISFVVWYVEGYNMQGCNTKTVIGTTSTNGVTQTTTTSSDSLNIYPSSGTIGDGTFYAGGIYRNTGAGGNTQWYALRIEPTSLPGGAGVTGQRRLTNTVQNSATNQSNSPITNTLTNITSL